LFNQVNLSWARLVSDLLSPPVVWAAMAFPIAFRDAQSRQQAVTWALVYGALVCVLPMVYVALMVRRGSITDLHMGVREQRIRPFIVSLVCTVFAWWVLRLMGAPPVVPLFALFSVVQIAVMALITLVWQISVHAMSITGAAVAAFAFFGPLWALPILPLVVLVGAARLNLKRHTLAQVLAGSALGVLIPLLVFAVV
jgi:membrane-associated phospholipid phosphatase